jgi:hypothetical protein
MAAPTGRYSPCSSPRCDGLQQRAHGGACPFARLQARVERAHAGAERFYRPLGVLRLAQAALERLLARLLLGVQRVMLVVQGGLVCLRVCQGVLQGVRVRV